MTTQGTFVPLVLLPGEVRPVTIDGQNFHVVFSPADIEIKYPGGEWGAWGQGTGIGDIPGGGTFARLEVRNPTLGTVNVVLYIGGPRFNDSRSNVIEPKTAGVPAALSSLAGSTGHTATGVPNGKQIRRKAIVATNKDQNLDLELRDAAGGVLLTIFPRTSITLPISEHVVFWNPHGSPVSCNFSEIWWTL